MNKSITLIFLGDFFFDARCINMADTIIDAGVDLNIIDAGKSNNQYRGRKIYHISLPKRGLFKYIKFYHETKNVLAKINPQQIIAGDLYSLPAATSFKDAFIVYDSREIYTQLASLTKKPFRQAFWSWIEKKYINKAQSVLVTAEGDGVILNNLYGDINIFHIYNFPSIKMKPEGNICLRDKLNLPAETKIFLYQGVLHQGRGIKTIIQLLKDFPNSHAVIIGDGPYRKKLQSFSEKINLEERIHFLGKVPYKEMLELTMGADIGFSLIEPISISYIHALPNKLFEYFLAGIPAIASDFPEMKNAMQNYPSGAVVPPNDLSQIVIAVSNLLAQPNNREENQRFALNNYVWETQNSSFLETLGI